MELFKTAAGLNAELEWPLHAGGGGDRWEDRQVEYEGRRVFAKWIKTVGG